MRALPREKRILCVLCAVFRCFAALPNTLFAADDGTAEEKPAPSKTDSAKSAAAKPASSKIDAPQPGLTERERWLLDRVEQLEKRVAELEAKGNPNAARPAEAPAAHAAAAQPARAELVAGPAATASAAGVAASSGPASATRGEATETAANVAASNSSATLSTKQDRGAAPPAKTEPFAFADFTWLNGNARTKDLAMDTKFFTPEVRADISYIYDFNHPKDDTIGGSSEVFRSKEVQVTQLGVGGDFHYNNVRARLMTQFGMYSFTTPRNDASPARGQWELDTAYRYVSEAYGGYHINALDGINIEAGIFMSYIGLFSYYNFDNWAYQPSYVSSNTPWFFNGLRVQIFPSDKLKIEPWFINGWQSYGRFNGQPGVGLQVLWRPTGSFSVLGNQYFGADTLGNPDRKRLHTDDSVMF